MITCEFEDGGKGKLRHVTVNALVIKDDKILLGKRGTLANGKPLDEAGKWSLLGGFMGRDENLEEGLRREIMEPKKPRNPKIWSVDILITCIRDRMKK
jgi:hypothetical protein